MEKLLDAYKNVSIIEAIVALEYTKNYTTLQGDASLIISEREIDLKIYYLGFLVGSIKESNGIVESSQHYEKNKIKLVVDGLRNCFFWWRIDDYAIAEEEDFYIIRNYNRKIIISKKTMLPVEQKIELSSGEQLHIYYEKPVKTTSLREELNPFERWYQSSIKIQLNDHILFIKIKSFNFIENSHNISEKFTFDEE
ncbi:MAG: hypothetical protein N2511_00955 [Thermodesulfovibrionales bacterium]|nr:hypothetical protein [Thermodesulfovibrionales bacterium]